MARLPAVLRSRRARAAVLAAVAVTIALLPADFALLRMQHHKLEASIQSTARTDVLRVARLLRTGAPAEELHGAPGDLIQVVDTAGLVSLESPALHGAPALAAAGQPLRGDTVSVAHLRRLPAVVADGRGPYLMLSTRVTTPREGARIVFVAASLHLAELSEHTTQTGLDLQTPLLILLVAVAAWFLAAHALRPVEAIRVEAGEIARRDLSLRIADQRAAGEVVPLVRSMNELLEQLEASAARQRRFVADASHELRSPLTAIQLQLDVALALPERTDWRAVADAVMQEVRRMQRIVEDLLLLARVDEATLPLRRDQVDLDELALAEARRLRNRGKVMVDTSGISAARVTGDRHRLTQVARNLAANAERHARQQVRLEVRRLDGGEAELVVADDGPGIPPEDRERVFERFTRLDEARSPDRGGAGLGLAIVREIVQAHGGTVAVAVAGQGSNDPNDSGGSGARLVVRLPADGPSDGHAEGHEPTERPELGGYPAGSPRLPGPPGVLSASSQERSASSQPCCGKVVRSPATAAPPPGAGCRRLGCGADGQGPPRLPSAPPPSPSTAYCLTASTSISRRIFLESSQPPVSRAEFQLRPQSSRSTSAKAEKPARMPPHGSGLVPRNSRSKLTGRVASSMVRSPVSSQTPSPAERSPVERKVIFGYFSTLKKSGDLRWPSRRGSWVSTLAVSISTSTVDCSGTSATWAVTVAVWKRPRTLAVRCRATNSKVEWAASATQVPASGTTRPSTTRDPLGTVGASLI